MLLISIWEICELIGINNVLFWIFWYWIIILRFLLILLLFLDVIVIILRLFLWVFEIIKWDLVDLRLFEKIINVLLELVLVKVGKNMWKFEL